MTLGPAILLLAFLPQFKGRLAKPFLIFGRVPLFYYVLHIYLIHGLAALFATMRYGSAPWMFKGLPNTAPGTELPSYYGYGLGTVYLIWIGVLLILYPLCRWFAGVKQRRRNPWLSYL
jgi:predicted acyltransferase